MSDSQISESLLLHLFNSVVTCQNNVQRLSESGASAEFIEFAEREVELMWAMYCGAATFWFQFCQARQTAD